MERACPFAWVQKTLITSMGRVVCYFLPPGKIIGSQLFLFDFFHTQKGMPRNIWDHEKYLGPEFF